MPIRNHLAHIVHLDFRLDVLTVSVHGIRRNVQFFRNLICLVVGSDKSKHIHLAVGQLCVQLRTAYPPLMFALTPQRTLHFLENELDYVCCQENGEPRSLTAMNQALTKICNRNGLPNITVHGLRHMFATILIELGVPLFKISGLLGHSSVHTTYEYYCEIMDEQDKIIAFVNNTFVPQQTGTEG